MSDQPDVTTPEMNQPNPAPNDGMIPRSRLNEVLERERKANERLAELERKAKEAEQADALKRGDHEKIIAELTPQAERAKVLESLINQTLASEIATLPEAVAEQAKELLDLIPTPEGRLAALPRLRALIPSTPAKPTPPPSEGGRGQSSGSEAPNLTEAQKRMIEIARQNGYSIDPNQMGKRSRVVVPVTNQTTQ